MTTLPMTLAQLREEIDAIEREGITEANVTQEKSDKGTVWLAFFRRKAATG